MINFHSSSYVTSCPDYSFRPQDNLPEVVFVGKSNVGKSSLINALVNSRLAYSSKQAGKTRYLNYFLVDDTFYLVDSPGYGYTRYGSKEDENFGTMMESYFANPTLKGAVLLLDARRTLSDDDKLMAKFLSKNHLPRILVYTKSDLAKQSELAARRVEAAKLGFEKVFFSKNGAGIDSLRSEVSSFVGK